MNRFRPVLLLVSASLLPVLILATLIGWLFIHDQEGKLDTEVQDRAALLSRALHRELTTQIQLLSVVADSPRLDLPVSRTSFAETARRLTGQVPAWQQIRVSDKDGRVALAFPAMSPSAPKTVVDRESHDSVFASRQAVIGNMVIGPQGRAAFAVRVPIRRDDQVQAVLSAVIRPDFVTQVLISAGLPENWSAWVVDGDKRLVASTDQNDLAGKPLSELLQANDDNHVELTTGEVLRLATADVAGTSWRVEVGLPLELYARGATQATALLLAASLVTLLLSGVIGYLFYRELRARSVARESLANWQRMDALGKLTGQAAHDFNNLLMIFQSGIEGIERRRNDPERVSRLLTGMRDGVVRGKDITRRLLSFARRSSQGAEHIELDVKLAELEPLLKQALNDGIVLKVDVSQAVWPIHADPSGLEIALVNVLTNAREAMTAGGTVSITARNVPEAQAEVGKLAGAMVALTLTDTGKGIPMADLIRVFEPFYSSKANGGPGLGLTQVIGFAEVNGGTAQAASLPGQGSAITIFLPKSTRARTERVVEDGQTLPATVLVVDDTPASLEAARLALEDAVATVHLAGSGSEALDALLSHPEISAVVSDIMMPGMSGIELAEKIRQLRPDVAIVLMTGYSDKLEAGAQLPWQVVAKPFQRSELIAALSTSRSRLPDLTNVVRMERNPGH